jgi:hypothetical protein
MFFVQLQITIKIVVDIDALLQRIRKAFVISYIRLLDVHFCADHLFWGLFIRIQTNEVCLVSVLYSKIAHFLQYLK